MVNKRNWLGILAIVLVFGMTVVGCGDSPADNSGNTGPNFGSPPGTVTITGTTYVDQILTANTDNLGGSGNMSYQWYRGDTADMVYTTINNGTGKNYSLTGADLNKYIRVSVNRSDYISSVSSNTIGPITAGPPLTGTVSITGTAKVGQTLTANTGSLGGNGNISYQWKRGDSAGAVNTNITNATESNYILSEADFGKYVAVSVTRSGYGSNVSSTAIGPVVDAMVWVQVNNSIFGTDSSVNSVAYNGSNQWVAVGNSGILAYSANGENWTKVDLSSTAFVLSGSVANINAIAYANGRWIAVGNRGRAAISTNGTTWTGIEGSPFGGNTISINAIAYGNNRWIAGGNNGVMRTSTDNGDTWTNLTHPFGSSNAINGIAYGSNRWVAVGDNGSMATSTDGQNWTTVDVASIFTYTSTVRAIQTVTYANNRWIAAGGGGRVATSTNGTTWTAVDTPFGGQTVYSVTYGNSKWVAVGGTSLLGVGFGSRMIFSNDGTNWVPVSDNSFGDEQINGIAFGNNKWVAVGGDSKIAYANDN
jgi:hypothetical protein